MDRAVDSLSGPMYQASGEWSDWMLVPQSDELFAILRPRLLRNIDNNDRESRISPQGARCGLSEELVPGERAVESGVHCGFHEIAVRQRLPAALGGCFAGNAEIRQNGDRMHIHVGVKQPHRRIRLVQTQL